MENLNINKGLSKAKSLDVLRCKTLAKETMEKYFNCQGFGQLTHQLI